MLVMYAESTHRTNNKEIKHTWTIVPRSVTQVEVLLEGASPCISLCQEV